MLSSSIFVRTVNSNTAQVRLFFSIVSGSLMLFWLYFCALVAANTETLLIKVPRHYDIPPHPHKYVRNSQPHEIDLQTYDITDFFIARNRTASLGAPTEVEVPYNQIFRSKDTPQTLLVRLNNYEDAIYGSNDVIYVKLCWPATLPFSVSLSHRYIEDAVRDNNSEDLLKDSRAYANQYVQIDFYADVYPVKDVYMDELTKFKFNLHISKLGNIPIPYEILELVVYIVDLAIVAPTLTYELLRWFD